MLTAFLLIVAPLALGLVLWLAVCALAIAGGIGQVAVIYLWLVVGMFGVDLRRCHERGYLERKANT